jgi:histidinol-phosphate phosphatase family domain/HAD-superfamily hydrolase, subfamily IIIA
MAEQSLPQAVMLDRDGTIVLDTNYLRDPATVELLPGAAEAITRLSARGIPAIVITNQSGIARGIISLGAYRAVRLRIEELLREQGAVVLDSYCCPHHPEVDGPCACRKPGTELYERAARAHGLDLSRCVFIGDKTRDVEPARKFGARAWLVRSNRTGDTDVAAAESAGTPVVASLRDAVDSLLRGEQ